MDKTLADCWDFVRRHAPASFYFADCELLLDDDDPSLVGWRTEALSGGRYRVVMSRSTLTRLAAYVPSQSGNSLQ